MIYRRSLNEALLTLPWFLCNYPADDEVVDFTQNGGWRKTNYLLPLRIFPPRGLFEFWMGPLRIYRDDLEVSCFSLRRGSV